MPEIEEIEEVEEKKIEEVDSDSDDDDAPELDNVGGDDAGGKQNRGEKKCRKVVSKLGMKPVNGIIRITIRKSKNILFVISKPDVLKAPGSDTYVIFGEAKIEDMAQNQMRQQMMRQAGGGGGGMPGGMPGMGGGMDAEKLKKIAELQKEMGGEEGVAEMLKDPSKMKDLMQKMKDMGLGEAMGGLEQALEAQQAGGKELEAAGDTGGDEGDFEEKDIQIIMDQGGCSRADAVKALKANNNDVVEAIMSISS